MPGGNPGHLNLRPAGGARTNHADRTAWQAGNDRLGQWHRVHVERHPCLGTREQDHLALHRFIAPGKPMQNGFCESFNGRMRDELLNESLFFGLDHARTRITDWAEDYNDQRPHSALGYLTPAAYAANLTATCDRLRNPDQLRRSHVAPPAPDGVKPAQTLIAAG